MLVRRERALPLRYCVETTAGEIALEPQKAWRRQSQHAALDVDDPHQPNRNATARCVAPVDGSPWVSDECDR